MRRKSRTYARAGGVYQIRNDRFWRYRGGGRNISRENWSKSLPLKPCRSIRESLKFGVDPTAFNVGPPEELRVMSGNSSWVPDTKSQGVNGIPLQQPIAARIWFPGLCCSVIGLLWQQHFSPQPELASTPAANKLAPKVRVSAMQITFKMSNLVGGVSFFIVN